MIGRILRIMYGRSGSVIFNDRCTLGISSRIRKNCTRQQHDSPSRDSSASRVKKCNSTGLCVPYNVRDKSTYAHVVKDDNDGQEQEKSSSTYANMIARYGSALKSTPPLNTMQKFCYEHNVSFTKSFEDLASLLKLRDIEVFLKGVSNDKSVTVYKNPRNNDVSWDHEPKDADWLKNVETIINDLKRSVVLKEVKVSSVPLKLSKYQISNPTEQTSWLDRVVQAHKANLHSDKSPPNDDETQANTNTQNNLTGIKNAVEVESPQLSGTNYASSVTDYLNRGSINQNRAASTEGSQHIIGGNNASGEEPKVELRMSSSQNDSVVSINVDSISQKGTTNAKELSVVVQSSKNLLSKPISSTKVLTASPTLQKSLESNLQNSTVNSKLKSMRISISEESVPVKQIEFAINGRPVSQLKSIIARSDKLDVVTSVDKIEIRVPFTKDKANVSVDQHSRAVMADATASKPVLNLQISANFDEPYAQQYGYTPYRAEVKQTPNPPPTPSSPPNTTPTPKSSGSSGGKEYKFGDGNSHRASGDIPAPIIPRPARSGLRHSIHTDGHLPSDRSSNSPRQESNASPRKSDSVTGDHSQMNASSNAKLGSRTSKRSFTKVENKDRVASNIIPWWSSEEAFNNLKKKSETKRADSASTDTSSRKAWTVNKSENAKDVKRSHKVSATSRQKSAKYANSVTPFPRKKSTGIKKSRTSHSSERRTKNAGKKGREPFWQSIPDVVQNVDGVNIKMKEKLDHDTIHVQDQLKSNGVKAKSSSAKSEAAQRVADSEEKSKIFHRDSVIVKTESQKSTSEKKPEVKLAPEKPIEKIEYKPYIEGDSSDRQKQEKKTENILLSDTAVKSFMDAMKPIEKRKDGTLIDFGMKVSSRRMPDKKNSKLENMRSKSANVETVKVETVKAAPLSKLASTPTEKIIAKESKVLDDNKKSEPIISTEAANEGTKGKLSSKQQKPGTDIKVNTEDTKIPEKRISHSATIPKTTEGTQTPQKPASKISTDTEKQPPPKKADASKPSSASTHKESPTKINFVCSSRTTIEPQKRQITSRPATTESALHESSRTSTTPKKVALPEKESLPKDAGKKVSAFSVERKMANVSTKQTRDNQNTVKTKAESNEKMPTTPKTGAATNLVKEKKADNDSRRLEFPITDQSLKKAAHVITKGENSVERSSITKTGSAIASSSVTSDPSVPKFSKVALEAAEMKKCKSGFSTATKTTLETRNHHQQSPASKHYTKKEKPKYVNTTT